MDIRKFTAEDKGTVAAVVELRNAADKVDAPFSHPDTVHRYTASLLYGWDGETPETYAAWDEDTLVGVLGLSVSEWDNTHLAWAGVAVHPDARRRGYGTQLFEFAIDRTRELGRRSIGCDAWDGSAGVHFAAKLGLQRKSSAINRRQTLSALDRGLLDQMYDEAKAAASSYELLRLKGRTPDDMLDAVAEMTASINDAPTDDLDIEDEVFPKERIVDYENAQQASGNRLYRVVARHRESGELAGHSVVVVETERPAIGDQHDTSVLRSHRGHRLGLLLKADMLRLLSDEEPQLETIDTWNAESNDHMIEVNQKLGYEVLGRELQFQTDI